MLQRLLGHNRKTAGTVVPSLHKEKIILEPFKKYNEQIGCELKSREEDRELKNLQEMRSPPVMLKKMLVDTTRSPPPTHTHFQLAKTFAGDNFW